MNKLYFLPEPVENGLAALGGDYESSTLELCYSKGLFPWINEGGVIYWFSPEPRMVITADSFKVPKSLRSLKRSHEFEIEFDTHFQDIMKNCMERERKDQDGTWILPDMFPGYLELFHKGKASCCSAMQKGNLVAGLYGVKLGNNFSGESMFSLVKDSSKISFSFFAEKFFDSGGRIIDCQTESELFRNFGGLLWDRKKFMSEWEKGLS